MCSFWRLNYQVICLWLSQVSCGHERATSSHTPRVIFSHATPTLLLADSAEFWNANVIMGIKTLIYSGKVDDMLLRKLCTNTITLSPPWWYVSVH